MSACRARIRRIWNTNVVNRRLRRGTRGIVLRPRKLGWAFGRGIKNDAKFLLNMTIDFRISAASLTLLFHKQVWEL